MAGLRFAFWYLLDWRGRIGRLAYVGGTILAIVIYALANKTFALSPLLWLCLLTVGLLVTFAMDAKRLHDLGRSALWILWIMLGSTFWTAATLITMIPWSHLTALKNPADARPFVASLGLWLLVGLVLPLVVKLLWLMFAAGTEGYNDYEFDGRPRLFGGNAIIAGQPAGPSPIARREFMARTAPEPAKRATFGRRTQSQL